MKKKMLRVLSDFWLITRRHKISSSKSDSVFFSYLIIWLTFNLFIHLFREMCLNSSPNKFLATVHSAIFLFDPIYCKMPPPRVKYVWARFPKYPRHVPTFTLLTEWWSRRILNTGQYPLILINPIKSFSVSSILPYLPSYEIFVKFTLTN